MLKVNELFSGIGAFRKALINLGVEHEVVGIAEIDKYAIKSYEAMYGPVHNYGDISKSLKLDYADMWTYGFPCQDISVAGKQAGIERHTRSGLLYQVQRLLEVAYQYDELPKYLILENVKNLVGKKFRADFDGWLNYLNELGYNNYWKVLNAKNYGVPQNRERVFVVSIRKDIDTGYEFPMPFDNGIRLKDVLEDEVDEKFYLNDKQLAYVLDLNETQNGTKWEGRTNAAFLNNSIARTIGCRSAESQRADLTNIIVDNERYDIKVNEFKVAIKEATKQGYAIAEEGDSINIAFPNSDTRRGRVGKSVPQTLETSCNQAVIDAKPRKDIKELEKHCEYCGEKLGRKRFNGRLEDFGVFNNRKYCDRECMRKAFVMVGENEQSWSTAHATARKINELFLQKDSCEICGGTQSLDIHHIDGNWQNNELSNLMCLCRSCHTKYEKNKNKKCGYRIRKLTPRETWRLMGFSDSDFQKCVDAGISNSQLYKQAGNSIVVDVLFYMLESLLKGGVSNR